MGHRESDRSSEEAAEWSSAVYRVKNGVCVCIYEQEREREREEAGHEFDKGEREKAQEGREAWTADFTLGTASNRLKEFYCFWILSFHALVMCVVKEHLVILCLKKLWMQFSLYEDNVLATGKYSRWHTRVVILPHRRLFKCH